MLKAASLLLELPKMDLRQLRQQWLALYGQEAGPTMSRRLLTLAVAYRAQELEQGLSDRCEALRAKASTTPRMSEESARGYTQHLKPGSKLFREYNGQIHEVLVLEGGCFVYRGQVSRSLTAVARRITGKHPSGTNFFGLKRKKRSNSRG
jgi:Protein of unknown function (DUF2924)